MPKSKFSENITKLRCSVCKRTNYHTRKNKKTFEGKLELKKYCKWCRASTKHVEVKR